MNHSSINSLLSRNESLAKLHLIAALGTRATQAWVKALVWHSFRVSSRIQTMILVDTGASAGNYASSAFMNLVEKTSHEGGSIKKPAGKGYLRAVNPHSVEVPPMPVIGSCTIPLVFPTMNRVYEATVRVVQDLHTRSYWARQSQHHQL